MKISSCGDIGDCVFLLNIIRQISGGPHVFCLRKSDATKARGDEGVKLLHDLIAPLALAQPYIKSVEIIQPGDPVDWASEGFRMASYVHGQTLMQAHLNHLVAAKGIGMQFDNDKPWLEVEPSKASAGRIVINRTGRYRSPHFRWDKVVAHYRHRLLFVGVEHEWREFVGNHGYVEFYRTKNMLEVAELIAGSELFIGNQSCANALNEGLKHPLIQEVSPRFPDCIFKRSNAQYSVDGGCVLPDIDGSGVLEISSQAIKWQDFNLKIVPNLGKGRMGWFYQHGDVMLNESMVTTASRKLAKLTGWSLDKCAEEIVKFTVRLNPQAFANRVDRSQFFACQRSLEGAGIKDHPIFNMAEFAQNL